MRAFFTTLVGLVCIVLLILGNLHWQKKIEVAGSGSSLDTDTKEANTEAFIYTDPFHEYTANWSEEEREQFQISQTENRPYRILVVGSEQMGEGDSSWPVIFQQEMKSTYGEEAISIDTITFKETTSDFIQADEMADLFNKPADLIIWEPFVLSDNGVVPIETTFENITSVINEVKTKSPNTLFILQPPNPLYQPKLYKTQVDALQAYSDEHQIPYLNHWTGWPDSMSEDIRDYLNEYNQPNEKGHQIWAQYLIDRFIASAAV